MILGVKCPACGKEYKIELVKAQAEIDRLTAENKDMRARLAAADALRRANPFAPIFGG